MADSATDRSSPNEFVHFEISDSEFQHIREMIYREAGINLTPQKKLLAQTRLGKLMRRNGISGFDHLFSLIDNDKTGLTMEMVIDAISTNHTFFFREDAHFALVNEEVIPRILNHRKRSGNLKMWSAGCSTGEEPYTAIITFLESKSKNKLPSDVNLDVIGTDISTDVLNKAQNGVYPLDSIENLDLDLKKKYFQRGRGQYHNYVRVKPEIKEKVRYKHHNLLQPFTEEGYFDLIFCRNTMIYFDLTIKQQVVDNLLQKLNKGGFLIIGHSESLNNITHPLTTFHPTIYELK